MDKLEWIAKANQFASQAEELFGKDKIILLVVAKRGDHTANCMCNGSASEAQSLIKSLAAQSANIPAGVN